MSWLFFRLTLLCRPVINSSHLCMLPFAKLLLSRGGINIPLLECELDYVTSFVQWDPSTLKVNRGLKSVCTWGLSFLQNLEISVIETRTSLLEDGKLHKAETSCLLFQRWSPVDLTSYEWRHPKSSCPAELPSDHSKELPSLLRESWANKVAVTLSYSVSVLFAI